MRSRKSRPLHYKDCTQLRVQEKERRGLYPCRARKMTEVGYRKRKSAICTRFEHKARRKPGTGEWKGRSVPDFSTKSDENRVQEREKCHLYPCKAWKMKETGYRRRKRAICTRQRKRGAEELSWKSQSQSSARETKFKSLAGRSHP